MRISYGTVLQPGYKPAGQIVCIERIPGSAFGHLMSYAPEVLITRNADSYQGATYSVPVYQSFQVCRKPRGEVTLNQFATHASAKRIQVGTGL
jgi:hypothetical protein